MATSSLRYAGCPRTPPPIGGVAIRRKVVLVKSGRHKTFTTDDAATADALRARVCAILRQMEPLGRGRCGGAASLASQEVTSGVRKRMAEWQTVAECNGR
ncbi:unnamed protein product [Ixodes persulcatus]